MSYRSSRIGTLLLVLAIVSLIAVGTMMFGARLGLWEPIVGFGYIRKYMNPIAYALLAISLAGFIYQLITRNRAGTVKALLASLIGLGLLAPMLYSMVKPTKRTPPIHDITTDTNNPPQFLVLDETRPGAKNSLVYAGEKVAVIQKKAYPQIAPIQSKLAAPEAFGKALSIAKEKGWEIVAEDSTALRFEAIARTAVYRFMDDVVVVVTPTDNTSRVDIRSISRIGRSDRGVNAARISDFIQSFGK